MLHHLLALVRRPGRRLRRRRPRAAPHPADVVAERLEPRVLLDGTRLAIGSVEDFRHVDSDGDAIDIRIRGSAGTLNLVEDVLDGVGDEDGVLEPGEELALVRSLGAAPDFTLEFVHRGDLGTGDAVVRLGRIEIDGPAFDALLGTDGSAVDATFEATSVRAGIVGRELHLDRIGRDATGAGLVLSGVAAGARVHVTESVAGRLVLPDGLSGSIVVGGDLAAGVLLGGTVPRGAEIVVAGAVLGDVRALGGFGGRIAAGELRGDLRFLETVYGSAAIEFAARAAGDATFARDFHGTLVVGGEWRGDVWIGGAFGGTAAIRTGGNLVGNVRVDGGFLGAVRVGGRTYGEWDLNGIVYSTARIEAGSSLVVEAHRDVHGRFDSAGAIVLEVGGTVGGLARIGWANTGTVSLLVRGECWADLRASRLVYLRTGGDVRAMTRIASGDGVQVVSAGILESGAIVHARTIGFERLPLPLEPGVVVLRGNGPFVLASSGRYRLGNDVTLAGGSGTAITILADDVTLDLDGHVVSGTFGPRSLAEGIRALGHARVTVRNGTVRGFHYGVQLVGDGGSAIEGILADRNHYLGLWVEGRGSRLVDNVVRDHGGSALGGPYTVAIAMKAIGPRTLVEGNVLAGTIRRQVVEQVGLHVDAGAETVVRGNLLDLGGDRSNAFGLWINAGDERQGRTSVELEDNLVVRTLLDVAFTTGSSGRVRDQVTIDTTAPLFANVSGLVPPDVFDLGGNLAADRVSGGVA